MSAIVSTVTGFVNSAVNKSTQLANRAVYWGKVGAEIGKFVYKAEGMAPPSQVEFQKVYSNFLNFVKGSDHAAVIVKDFRSLGANNKEAAEKAFNRQKALNIGETIISTYSTAQKAYASQFTPVPTPDSPARGAIAAGIAIAGGLARIAAISSQKFQWTDKEPSTPSASGAAAGGGSIPQPQFNIVGQSGTNQLAAGIGAQFNQPLRAYVVGGEVTTAQQLERQRVRTATFG